LGIGAGALWVAARLRREARRSRHWLTLTGRILCRGVISLQSDARSFTPRVRYSYTVAGKEYVGDRVYRTGSVGRLKASAQRLTDSLPESIPVHYNPENPAEAYLLTEPAAYYWITLSFGVGALLWGVVRALALIGD